MNSTNSPCTTLSHGVDISPSVGYPMLFDQPPIIIVLPAQLKPTKRVLSFIANGHSQLQIAPLHDLASPNPFATLVTTTEPPVLLDQTKQLYWLIRSLFLHQVKL